MVSDMIGKITNTHHLAIPYYICVMKNSNEKNSAAGEIKPKTMQT